MSRAVTEHVEEEKVRSGEIDGDPIVDRELLGWLGSIPGWRDVASVPFPVL